LTIFAELKIPVESIRLGGGGARGALWRQIQADVYGMSVGLLEVEEGPAYGAALLAGVGVGNWTSVEKACDATVRVSQRIEPDPRHAALMNRQYGTYRKLYPVLRDIWRDGPS
jgi:xylulokinase